LTREEAIRKLLRVLASGGLALMSVPMRDEALRLAREHQITAEDLLLAMYRRALNA
jgi:hypothetical protein